MKSPQQQLPQTTATGRKNNGKSDRILLKGLLIGALILVMLIPSALITNLVKERSQRQQEVIAEVSRKWAGSQTIMGPILMLPYHTFITQANGKTVPNRNIAYILPDQLAINANLLPENRHRSIYDVTLFRSAITMAGSFSPKDLAALSINPDQVFWKEARILIGIDDARGLEDEVVLQWDSSSRVVEAGIPENKVLATGLSIPVPYTNTEKNVFSIHLKIKGSEHLYFAPLGKTTTVQMLSPWKSPAFDGKYIPDHITAQPNQGFKANWKILQMARPYPQLWSNSSQKLSESAFGVKLLQPADSYTKTERSVKYALLFISLTFALFFFIELLQKKQIHPLQYFLVGIALIVFYTLLLSISEYTGFNIAYALAAFATISLTGFYIGTMFKQKKTTIGFTLALGALYAYIFFLIQLQDYALLFGSIGLFIIVALAMYSSRKIDWYQVGQKTIPANS